MHQHEPHSTSAQTRTNERGVVMVLCVWRGAVWCGVVAWRGVVWVARNYYDFIFRESHLPVSSLRITLHIFIHSRQKANTHTHTHTHIAINPNPTETTTKQGEIVPKKAAGSHASSHSEGVNVPQTTHHCKGISFCFSVIIYVQ